MKPETLEALKKSIEHWERLASGTPNEGERPNGDNCALCKLHFRQPNEPYCAGCPVAIAVGETHCDSTPFYAASDAWWDFGINSAKFREAAREELHFLRSLLPKTGESETDPTAASVG